MRIRHSIRVAAARSGLSPHVIRVWERRYRAVQPSRTGSNRRFYSEEEIERLTLLHRAVGAGHRISHIARLPVGDLRQLTLPPAVHSVLLSPASSGNGSGLSEGQWLEHCLEAVRRMDGVALEQRLTQALLAFGHQGFLRRIAAPMAQSLGDLWQQGTLAAAHEHFATVILRTFLENCGRSFPPADAAPCLVVATPPGNIHELGALLVAAAARNLGWRVLYLGASLPAAEIAGAAVQNHARAVALSIVYPADDPNLGRELAELRRFLPAGTVLLVGGRAASAYDAELRAVDAVAVADLESLASFLEELRLRGNGAVAGPGAPAQAP